MRFSGVSLIPSDKKKKKVVVVPLRLVASLWGAGVSLSVVVKTAPAKTETLATFPLQFFHKIKAKILQFPRQDQVKMTPRPLESSLETGPETKTTLVYCNTSVAYLTLARLSPPSDSSPTTQQPPGAALST